MREILLSRATRSQLLSRWTQRLNARLDLEPLMGEVCGVLLRLSGADRCSIMVLDTTTEELSVRWAQGVRVKPFGRVKFKLGQGLCGWVARSQKPLFSFDVAKESRFLPAAGSRPQLKPIKAFCCLPLVAEGRTVGVVNLSTFKPETRLNNFVKQKFTKGFLGKLAQVMAQTTLLREAEATNERWRRIFKATVETVAQLSHEVRTPLALVMEGTQQLLDGLQGLLSGDQKTMVERIKAQAERMSRLANELLDLSRIEAGRMSLSRKPLALAELIQEVVHRYEPLIAPRKLRVELETVAPAYGDRLRLTQVAENLLTNAVKFTPPDGTITLTLKARGRSAELSVTDTGMGIAKREQRKLFEKFFQGGMPAGSNVRGIGLGLTIVKEIVQLHGGTVRVASEVGEGTTFTVSLPFYSPAFALTEEFRIMREQGAREGEILACQIFKGTDNRPVSWDKVLELFQRHVSREDRVLENPGGGVAILSLSDAAGFEAMRHRLEGILRAHPEVIPVAQVRRGWALVPQEETDLSAVLRLAERRSQETVGAI